MPSLWLRNGKLLMIGGVLCYSDTCPCIGQPCSYCISGTAPATMGVTIGGFPSNYQPGNLQFSDANGEWQLPQAYTGYQIESWDTVPVWCTWAKNVVTTNWPTGFLIEVQLDENPVTGTYWWVACARFPMGGGSYYDFQWLLDTGAAVPVNCSAQISLPYLVSGFPYTMTIND